MIMAVMMITVMIVLRIIGFPVTVQHCIHNLVQRIFLHRQMSGQVTGKAGENQRLH